MGHTVIPARAKAEMGLALLKEAILDYLEDQEKGARNSELAAELNLRSDHEGQQSDYLTYSVLGILMQEGQVKKVKQNTRSYYIRS